MQAGMMAVIGVIFILLILSVYTVFVRGRKMGGKGRGRNYIPPDEVKRAQWRDREVARRIALEQEAAYERVSLRNETLAYYEAVKQRHMKLETMERLGLKPDKDKIDDMAGMGLDEYLNIR